MAAGIKKSGKPDLALIKTEQPACCAGTFTTNLGTTNCYTVELSGANSVDVCARYVNVSANGNTNNGALYLHFVRSLDGVTFETVSNGFSVAVPSSEPTVSTVLRMTRCRVSSISRPNCSTGLALNSGIR